MYDNAPIVWDKAAVKWLLKDPLKLQQRPGYWQWVLERGGLKEVQRFLRSLPLPADAAQLLQTILDDPKQRIAIYAARLNVSEPTYFRWFDDLIARLLVALNQQRPAILPLQTSLFIGRQDEIVALQQLLRQPAVRLVTLTGPGGIGKTALSMQAVRPLDESFADGIVFIPLAALRDPELLGGALIQAFGLPRTGSLPELELLIGHLRSRELLLVLDNFEQLLAATPLVSTLLEHAPRLTILVTSRSVLRLRGEQTFLVPPLSLPPPPAADAAAQTLEALAQSESIRLFVDRAHNVNPGFQLTSENAPAVAALCRRLDGLPLAIELAAARSNVLSPQAMVARLEHRLTLLSHGPSDLPARQQTMRQTLDWSYALLSPAGQGLFRQLAVFAGGCTFEAVCAVCQLAEEQALVGLAELLDQSMLQSQEQPNGEVRFSTLATIREYAEELLAQDGKAAALRRRHAAYYLALAEEAEPELTSGPRQKDWHDRLVREYGNIRAALSWSLDRQELELGVRLAAALWKFWVVYSYVADGSKWLLLARDQSVGCETQARCKVLYGTGWFTCTQGDHSEAGELFAEALALARRLNFRQGIGMALQGVGEVLTIRGEYAAAARCFEESVGIFRALGDQEETAWALSHLGGIRQAEGNVAEAARLFEESAALFRAVERQLGLFWAMHSLAAVLPDQDSGQLRGLIEESLAWFRALDDRLSMAWALHILGVMALDQAQVSEANARFDEALALFRELEVKPGLGATLYYRGYEALASGRLEEAARCYRESLLIQRDLGVQHGVAECLEGLAAVIVRQDEPRRAALLCGAVEALVLPSHVQRQLFVRRRSLQTRELIRAALPVETFDAAFAEGQTIPFVQLVKDLGLF